MIKHSYKELCGILNEQAGKMVWAELEKHFARGVVIKIAVDMDLIDVAATIIEDNKTQIEEWMALSKVSNVTAEDAKNWVERQPEFWGVVAAPWVVIQEIV